MYLLPNPSVPHLQKQLWEQSGGFGDTEYLSQQQPLSESCLPQGLHLCMKPTLAREMLLSSISLRLKAPHFRETDTSPLPCWLQVHKKIIFILYAILLPKQIFCLERQTAVYQINSKRSQVLLGYQNNLNANFI